MNIDLSLNRVYWEYVQNKSYCDLTKLIYALSDTLSIGVRATVPEYKRRSKSFHSDLTLLVKAFAKKYKDYNFILAMSGGIDSEVTAETFYQLRFHFVQ